MTNGLPRCKSCRYWIPEVLRRPHFGGLCDNPKIHEGGCDYGMDALVYPYAEGGTFWTGPEFGCVHHSIPIHKDATTPDENTNG